MFLSKRGTHYSRSCVSEFMKAKLHQLRIMSFLLLNEWELKILPNKISGGIPWESLPHCQTNRKMCKHSNWQGATARALQSPGTDIFPFTWLSTVLLAHSFIHSFAHSLIHSFIRLFIHSFAHSFIHSFIHSLLTSTPSATM